MDGRSMLLPQKPDGHRANLAPVRVGQIDSSRNRSSCSPQARFPYGVLACIVGRDMAYRNGVADVWQGG